MQKEINRWWNLAEDDLEKALKALWIQGKKEVPRYHDLLFFFQKLELPAKFKTACEDLTGGYITTRYPTNLEFSFNKKETELLLQQSEEILLWLKKKLS